VSGGRSLLREAALACVACIAAVAVAGCGGGASATDARGAAAASASACFRPPGHHAIGGELVDIPRRLPKRPPLLLVFHGLGETTSQIAGQTGFDELAARYGFVVAYPNALHEQRWQLNHSDGDSDIAHIGSFIDTVVARVCADPRRVYLTGFSNGAGFTARAGCELADRVAAIAPVSGSYRALDACTAGRMPTLEIHGRDPWLSTVPALIRQTKARNGCTHAAVKHRLAPGILRTRWPGCALERVVNDTIGHEWPELGAFKTSEQVWRFVRAYRR
jgi:polyhydroxybutyrate depolymerase